MKKIFIPGGAGYVGTVLAEILLKLNYKVTVYDLFIYGDHINDHPNLKKIKGDIRDLKKISNSVKDHNIVIHLACISNDPSYDLNPKLSKSINYDCFENFVKASKENEIERFIYASSSSVYGIKKEKNVYEDMKLEPLTDYSVYKVMCENILNKYSSENFITINARPSTVCGFSKRQRFDLVVNILTNQAYHTKKIKVFGGDQLRPNIHINDMCQAYVDLIKADSSLVNRQAFNIGFENFPVLEIANIVKKNMDHEVLLEKVGTDDIRSYHVSSEKIKSTINFKTKYDIDSAVRDLKNAFKNNFFKNPLTNEEYFNIKKMQKINLE
tara:strand:- start:1311 stop:2288 length:978 start_codon:yes stop_codon:yes gene_type:complete